MKRRVLYVDDDPARLRGPLEYYLGSSSVDYASTTSIAVEKLAHNEYCALIVDAVMPCGSSSTVPQQIMDKLRSSNSGVDLAVLLKTGELSDYILDHYKKNVPVIIITGGGKYRLEESLSRKLPWFKDENIAVVDWPMDRDELIGFLHPRISKFQDQYYRWA